MGGYPSLPPRKQRTYAQSPRGRRRVRWLARRRETPDHALPEISGDQCIQRDQWKAFGFRQQLEASQQLFFKDRTRFRLGGRGFAPGVTQALIWRARNRTIIPHFVRHVNKNQRQSVLISVHQRYGLPSGNVRRTHKRVEAPALIRGPRQTRFWSAGWLAGVTTCLGFAL